MQLNCICISTLSKIPINAIAPDYGNYFAIFSKIREVEFNWSHPGSGWLFKARGSKGWLADFLRKLQLKDDKTVYYYTGQLKLNQQAVYAVLDIPVRNKPLLQCADAVLLIRASWLFSQKKYEQINFVATDGTWLNYSDWCKGVRYILKGNKLLTVKHSGQSVSPELQSNLDRFLQQIYAFVVQLPFLSK